MCHWSDKQAGGHIASPRLRYVTTAQTSDLLDQAVIAARRVLEIEARALLTMAENLPIDFQPAVNAILSLKGRVVVSGIGKSGHIGRKIASTLASTGTPAFSYIQRRRVMAISAWLRKMICVYLFLILGNS